jgi:hypothetical protein
MNISTDRKDPFKKFYKRTKHFKTEKKHTDSPSYQLEYHLNVESADAEPNPGSTSTHTKSLRYNKEKIKQTLQKSLTKEPSVTIFIASLQFRLSSTNISSTQFFSHLFNEIYD